MMTPLELEKLEFEKKMGGYKKDSVDSQFLVVRNSYENLYKENIELRDKITVLEELVSKYKTMEDTMQNAIILAQQSGESAIAAARERADAIIKEAEAKAAAYENEMLSRQKQLKDSILNMEKDISVFAAKNISLLQSQIDILNKMKHDSLSDL